MRKDKKMLNLPGSSKNDMSSICNYGEDSTPSGSPATGAAAAHTEEADHQNIICSKAFAYRDEAIPFITIHEESSKLTLR